MGDITMDTKNMDFYYLDPATGEYKKVNRVDFSSEEMELEDEHDEDAENEAKETDCKVDICDAIKLLERIANLSNLDISLIAAVCAYEYDTLTIDSDDCICPSDIFCDFVAYSNDPYVASIIEVLVNEISYEDIPHGDNFYFEKQLRFWREAARTAVVEIKGLEHVRVFKSLLKSVDKYKWDISCLDSPSVLEKALERKAQCDANEKIKDLKKKHNRIKTIEDILNDSRKKDK